MITIERSDTLICVAKRIRRGRFDTAILFPNSPRSAMEVYLARVPERVGMAKPWRTWTLTKPVPSRTEAGAGTRRRSATEVRRLVQEQPTKPRDSLPASAHQVHDYLRIVEALGANATPLPPAIHVTAAEVGAIRERFGAIEGKVVVGLNPGAEYGPAKRWPEERFIEAARRVMAQTDCHCWIFGGAGDVGVAERIAAAVGKGAAVTRGQDIAARIVRGVESVRRGADERYGPDARSGGGGHTGGSSIWQHVAGIDGSGLAGGKWARVDSGRGAMRAVLSADVPD